MYDGSEDEEDVEMSDQSGDSEEDDSEDEDEEAAGSEEEVTDLREEESDDEEDESDHPFFPDVVDPKRSSKRAGIKVRNSELDDDFFSLDAFNRETEEAEAAAVSRGRLGRDSEDDESDYEGDSVDLFRPVDDAENLDEDASEDGAGMQYCILLSFIT
jgi:U3 small nucleolar RNA-associated protein MPP10